MKHYLRIISVALLIILGTSLALTRAQVNPPRQEGELGLVPSQGQEAPEALAQRSGCLECHSVDKDVVGPTYRAVAERYKDDPRARKTLFDSVKNGSKGKWTRVTGDGPMPPHSARLSKPDIERLVDWVLSLKDRETK